MRGSGKHNSSRAGGARYGFGSSLVINPVRAATRPASASLRVSDSNPHPQNLRRLSVIAALSVVVQAVQVVSQP